jgi:hypothetical protein
LGQEALAEQFQNQTEAVRELVVEIFKLAALRFSQAGPAQKRQPPRNFFSVIMQPCESPPPDQPPALTGWWHDRCTMHASRIIPSYLMGGFSGFSEPEATGM